jgi:hypothetical protein
VSIDDPYRRDTRTGLCVNTIQLPGRELSGIDTLCRAISKLKRCGFRGRSGGQYCRHWVRQCRRASVLLILAFENLLHFSVCAGMLFTDSSSRSTTEAAHFIHYDMVSHRFSMLTM